MSKSFTEFNLIEPIQRALEAESYHTATPIQAEAIPHLLAGRDLLGCAQTGTGKTAAFALPILQKLDQNRVRATPKTPRVLVLAPTRELAAQIGASFQTYGQNIRFRQAVVFGGVGQMPQVRAMSRGVHVLVATPGRLLDLMSQGHVRLDGLETFVLDEADRMLDLGFLPDLQRIIARLPKRRQSIFFSATMPPKIAELAAGLLTDPVHVVVTPPASTVDRIDQRVMFVERNDKRALLADLLDAPNANRVLVFTKTKRRADQVAEHLERDGVRAAAIHGNKSQTARERALLAFRTGRLRVLVATDIAARGIDVDGVTHVINYDLPHEPESYVHRIGRTARAGADGQAISFCDSSERSCLRSIERLIRRAIEIDAEHAYHSHRSQSAKPSPRGQRSKRGKSGGYRGGNQHANAGAYGKRSSKRNRSSVASR